MDFSPAERCVTFVLKVPKFAVWLVAFLLQPKLANLSKQGQEERDKVSEDATVSFFKAAGSWRNGQSSPLLHPDLWERINSSPSSERSLSMSCKCCINSFLTFMWARHLNFQHHLINIYHHSHFTWNIYRNSNLALVSSPSF